MSYSFSVTAATKFGVTAAIGDEMSKVVASQPVHEADAGKAIETACSLLGMMAEDPTRDIVASVSGSIWKTDDGIQQLSLSVNLGFKTRE